MVSGEHQPLAVYKAALTQTWTRIHQAFLDFNGHVIMTFPDTLTPTLDLNQRAYYLGELQDVGEDKSGQWIDIRITDHKVHSNESIRSSQQIQKEVTADMPIDSKIWSPAQLVKWANAMLMNREVQIITGNLHDLPIPDGTTRLYMESIGPLATVVQDFRYQ